MENDNWDTIKQKNNNRFLKMVPGENRQTTDITGECSASNVETCMAIYTEVRDLTSMKSCSKTTKILIFGTTTVREVIKMVAEEFLYAPDSFDIVQKFGEAKSYFKILNKHLDTKVCELEFSREEMTPTKLFLMDKERLPEQTKDEGAGDAPTTSMRPIHASNAEGCWKTEHMWNFNYRNSHANQETGFVGLVNQAMTCYLNSLLQTLYMTPEFRNAMYRWEFDGSEEEGTKSIPFQLQKLYLLLQTSKKPAVGTTQLTTSFGWDSSEAWQQHDVQELCRVMFDALEQTFKNTEQADLISNLYEGKLKDYVKCLECGGESAREDTFLDVPLVVRPFGSSEAYGSVEEALHAFVAPETLQGSNQYFCERCNKKCDAHKGLKFQKFPYLLTLQLKRFDFDPLTMHRIKLYDKVTFPEILDINEFIMPTNTETCKETGEACAVACATYDVKCDMDSSSEGVPESIDHTDDDEGIDVGMVSQSSNNDEMNEKNLRKSLPKGPYSYELFSIMVHSGSANGGHYYAYIKSFDDGEWYCFNDAQVTRITDDDIQRTYGGGPARGYYSSAYSSSVNAYMLMYRQIDKAKNSDFMSAGVFPDHIKVLLNSMIEQEERERQQKELDKHMCKIKLFCQHPSHGRMVEKKLWVHKDTTLAEATVNAMSNMGLTTVPRDCCRLVKYDDYHDSVECSFSASEEELIGDLLGGVKSSYKFDLLLEIKQPHEVFQEYKQGGTTVKVYTVDLDKEHVLPLPLTFRSHLWETVENFKIQIAQALGANVDTLRLVLEKFNNDVKILPSSTASLKSFGFWRSNKVFVEFQDEEDAKKEFEESKLYTVLDSHFHTICIHVTLPKVDKPVVDKLRVYEDENEPKQEKTDNQETLQNIDLNKICGELLHFNNGEFMKSMNNDQKTHHSITPDDSSQDCDEGLGDSEIGDSCSTSGYKGCQAVHSDQSEDSSLTDSERTLIGDELSPRNNSPDIMGTEMEVDVEPLHALSPDRSRPDSDSAHSSSDSNFQADEQTDDLTNPSSPEDGAKDLRPVPLLNKTVVFVNKSDDSSHLSPYVPVKRFFRACPYNAYDTGERMLRVSVDKRILLAALKKELEPHVGIGSENFKIYRIYSNNQEFECTKLAENLMSYTDETKLIVKLGRALRKGEYKVKVYMFNINNSEPSKFLIDWVIFKGMSVLQAKTEILQEIDEAYSLNISLNRCRLRKKSWKVPGTVFLDNQRFDTDIPINSNCWELFLQVLDDDEPVMNNSQLILFVRRWNRSTFSLDPMEEIVIDYPLLKCLVTKLSEFSGIPLQNLELAKASGTFPCDISLHMIEELDWFSAQENENKSIFLCVGEDGQVIYFRDNREELKQLTEEEKKQIVKKENARSMKGIKCVTSPKKEKALKIYTPDSMPRKISSNSSGCSISSAVDKVAVPDLD